jgi:ABC-type protease/lipase transport system fused ATPase/permease subunit
MNSMTTVLKSAAPTREPGNELGQALGACRSAIAAIAVASALINVLYLTGSFYTPIH